MFGSREGNVVVVTGKKSGLEEYKEAIESLIRKKRVVRLLEEFFVPITDLVGFIGGEKFEFK